MERISPDATYITALYEEDRKPGVGLTLVPNLK